MEGKVTQVKLFGIHGKFNPKTETIASVNDVDDAIFRSKIYAEALPVMPWSNLVRAREYAFYNRDPKAGPDREIVWVENGVFYKHSVPDIPVVFRGRQISLQKAAGLGVYDSIELLKIEQTESNVFTISVVDPSAIAGRVRVVDFMRGNWALPDGCGFPLATQPVNTSINGYKHRVTSDPAARHGSVRITFYNGTTGWHGSVARRIFRSDWDWSACVCVCNDWSEESMVAFVGPYANAAAKTAPST